MIESNNKPLISVIIPVYNVEKYLQDCIDSLLNQTQSDLELIFVNDASPDNSIDILKKNKELHPDIVIIDSPVNLCPGGARNLGIKASNGEYIAFLDSDDLVFPNMYETLYKFAKKSQADVTYIQYTHIEENTKLSDIDQNIAKAHVVWDDKLMDLNDKVINERDRMECMIRHIGGTWAALYKKSVIVDNCHFFPEHTTYEDNYWHTLLYHYINKICFVDKVCYAYRNKSNSIVNTFNAKHHLDRISIENAVLEVARTPEFAKYLPAFEYIYTTRYARNTCSVLYNKFNPIPVDLIKKIAIDLRREFPNYKNNKFYLERTSRKERLQLEILLRPSLYFLEQKLIKLKNNKCSNS